MNDNSWKNCLQVCRRVCGKGDWDPFLSESWCAFTTFSSLQHGVHYWNCGFPEETDFLEHCTLDGGLWRQSFEYSDLAHLVVPSSFYWERFHNGTFQSGYKAQDLGRLSDELNDLGILHKRSELILEIKLY